MRKQILFILFIFCSLYGQSQNYVLYRRDTLNGGGIDKIATVKLVMDHSFPGFGLTSTTAAYGNHNHSGIYEPVLGNPGTTGYVLSSTSAGVRSWVTQSGGGVITTAPLHGTTSLTIDQANTSQGGYLTSTDWNKFNGKLDSTYLAEINGEDTLYISSAQILSGINDTLVTTNTGTTQTYYTQCLLSYRHVSTAYTGGTTDTIAVFGKYKGVKKKLLYISSSYITESYSGRGQFPLAWDKLDPGSPIWVHIPSFSTGNGILRMRFIKKQENW